MSGRRTVNRGRTWRGVAVLMSLAVASACSVSVGPGAPTVRPFDEPTFQFDEPTGPPPGHWTGTITMHATINVDKTEPGHSDLDPTNIYYEEWVTTETVQLDATDTFTIDTTDDDDLTYGIHSVTLTGSAANAGNTLQRSVTLTDKRNSGCTWKQEDGTETSGSWSSEGDAQGELYLSEDGSYSIDIQGRSSDYAEVPSHAWLKYSDISANCEPNQEEYDTPMPGGPLVEWVSTHLEDTTVDGDYGRIEGQLNAANPGSSIDGTATFEYEHPEGLTITVTWHLVRDGPIVLPNSGPDAEYPFY